ncbi:MAG: hypothetical protein MUO21_07210, partial [Nitrososphaeraceae archaeon]|nr:hypothetical protein [Nitrososphaeraceae archaeon]
IFTEAISKDIDVSKINQDHLQIIVDATYNPKYIATIWKLYKYLYEKNKHGKKIFWMSSGNTVGYYKYNGQICWDDDIDLGFEVDDPNTFSNYIDFFVECLKDGFIVNLHMKKVDTEEIPWYENDQVVNLLLDSDRNPPWNHIKVTDFKNLMKTNPSKLLFGNVTLREECWLKIAKKLNLDELYRWEGNYLTTPWIDVIPHIKKDNKYICHLKGLNADLSTEFVYHDFLTVPGKFPVNLLEAILYQYNEKRSFENFLEWDTIYSHVKKTKMIFRYNEYPELAKFVKEYTKKFNEMLLVYMGRLSFGDLH